MVELVTHDTTSRNKSGTICEDKRALLLNNNNNRTPHRMGSAKGLVEGEYGSEDVMINKYTLSQSHRWLTNPLTTTAQQIKNQLLQ